MVEERPKVVSSTHAFKGDSLDSGGYSSWKVKGLVLVSRYDY